MYLTRIVFFVLIIDSLATDIDNTTVADEKDDEIDTVTANYNLTKLAAILFNQDSNITC
ncbi:hypothetical protein I4U23_030952 [Adineta vaga]|nr:hypothetical protein I4U23_030952 [Adineta vaga]